MSTEQRGYASVEKHKSDMADYAVFAESFAISRAYGAGYYYVAMRYVDSRDQPAGTKFSDRYAHWLGKS